MKLIKLLALIATLAVFAIPAVAQADQCNDENKAAWYKTFFDNYKGDVPAQKVAYDAAKNEQGHNEARVRQLEAMLKEAVVIEGSSNGEVVEPGVLVELQHEGDDDAITYLVGSIEERHDTYSVLSTESPLGQALLGAAPGTKVKYQGPKRELGVTVVAVRPLG